jgi:hypothetical protein
MKVHAFLIASHEQYTHDTAKEVQTAAVNTSFIWTKSSCMWRSTKTVLLGFKIFSGQVLSFYEEIVTSDHLEKENNKHFFCTFQGTCDMQ